MWVPVNCQRSGIKLSTNFPEFLPSVITIYEQRLLQVSFQTSVNTSTLPFRGVRDYVIKRLALHPDHLGLKFVHRWRLSGEWTAKVASISLPACAPRHSFPWRFLSHMCFFLMISHSCLLCASLGTDRQAVTSFCSTQHVGDSVSSYPKVQRHGVRSAWPALPEDSGFVSASQVPRCKGSHSL